jgi:glycosyltransferase involved in cell wall biosynthesis
VLTVSESSKNDILEWTKIPSSRVLVVGNGVSAGFTCGGPKYAGEEPYFLYVGAFRPHKNVPRILAAFAKSGLAGSFALMMSGRPDRSTLGQVRELRLERRVRFIGSPPDRDLAAYYRGATALVAPSLAEGFCLPALEAMACGCPVVAADRGAQRELLDGAGIYVNPENTEDVQRGMCDATRPQRRQQAIADGCRRAAAYSWDATAAKVREVLESAAKP